MFRWINLDLIDNNYRIYLEFNYILYLEFNYILYIEFNLELYGDLYLLNVDNLDSRLYILNLEELILDIIYYKLL